MYATVRHSVFCWEKRKDGGFDECISCIAERSVLLSHCSPLKSPTDGRKKSKLLGIIKDPFHIPVDDTKGYAEARLGLGCGC